MVKITPYLWNVKTVKLNYCCKLSTKLLLGLIHNCWNLCTLEVKGYYTSQDEDPITVHYGSTSRLRSLNLSFNRMLTDKYLAVLSKTYPYLSHLFVNGCKAITQKGLSQITRNCLGLKTIHMNGCDGIFILGLKIKVSGYKLEVLEARGSGLDDECLKVIALKCPDLMCLDVMNCWDVTALGLREVVMRCKNLERLGVSFKNIDPETEYFISSMKPWLVNRLQTRE